MSVITYVRPDGGLSIVGAAEGARLAISVTFRDGRVLRSPAPIRVDQFARVWPVAGAVAEWAETEAELLARVATKAVPAGIPFQIVDRAAIPTDRSFRDAWKADLTVDMPKARTIHRDRLRLARKPKFEVLDALWMKAVAAGDTVGAANAEAKRQALRDAPQFAAIDLATTPDQLKVAVPPILIDP